VAFNGSNALSTAGLVDVLHGSSDLTVIAVINPATTQPFLNTTIIDMSASDSGFSWRLTQDGLANNQFNLAWSQDAGQSILGATPLLTTTAGTVQMLSVVKAGASASSYLNGGVIGPVAVPAGLWNSPQHLVLGNRNFPSAGFQGQIMEVLIYNRALTDAERQQIETTLESKYSIQDNSSAIDPANGLPVSWEMKYFGHLGVDPNADPDGDGLTNWQEYLKGTDPTDYFNGVNPTIISLEDADGGLSSDGALSVLVEDANAKILVNAPVVFTATAGGHLFAANPGGSGASSIQARTNSNGIAKVYVVSGP
jgi:hypothetical protein